ncbi:MAG: class I SAM-dependent methyltransferase [Bdellovibrionales bacterium]|nr:class I SAM-dependent methyltransferase [Bdellovibrionales bacterium]
MTDVSNAQQLITELRNSRQALSIDNEVVEFVEYFGAEAGELCLELVHQTKPELILELGLAHGTSSLYLLQGIVDNGFGRLLSMDPYQFESFKGVGLKNIQRAGLDCFHQFICQRSDIALPLMINEYGGQLRSDFIFIDTSHQFDQTIVEAYFCDKILKPGGLIVFDDYGLASVKSACNFIESNLHYVPFGRQCNNVRVLRKTAEDDRRWYDFVPFSVDTTDQMNWRRERDDDNKNG